MDKNFSKFIKDLEAFDIHLSEKQLDQFSKYYDLLVEWNQKMNLTAITDFDDVCQLHFVDSISSCKYFDFTQDNICVIDIGTGAGFEDSFS